MASAAPGGFRSATSRASAREPGEIFLLGLLVLRLDCLDAGPNPSPDFEVGWVAVNLPQQGKNGHAETDQVLLRVFAGFEGVVSQFLDEGLDLAGIDFGPGSLFQLVEETRGFRVAPPPPPGLARLIGSQLLFANLDLRGPALRPARSGIPRLPTRASPSPTSPNKVIKVATAWGSSALARTRAARKRAEGAGSRRSFRMASRCGAEVALGQEDDGRGTPQRVVVAEGVDHCWINLPIFVVGDGRNDSRTISWRTVSFSAWGR